MISREWKAILRDASVFASAWLGVTLIILAFWGTIGYFCWRFWNGWRLP